jgi:hypothetical protein
MQKLCQSCTLVCRTRVSALGCAAEGPAHVVPVGDEGVQLLLPALPALLRQDQGVQLGREALQRGVRQQRLQHGCVAVPRVAVVRPAQAKGQRQALLVRARQRLHEAI